MVVTLLLAAVTALLPAGAITHYEVLRSAQLDASRLQVTLLVESRNSVTITSARVPELRRFDVTDGEGGIRTTITFTADSCASRLTIADGDDTRTWRRACQYLPRVER